METYLVHHGIKGQKWGIRRYQNEDGTLTAEGKKRYGDDGADYLNKKQAYKQAKKDYNKSYNKAYRETSKLHFTKDSRAKRDAAINDSYDKAKALQKAKEEMKSARKAQIKRRVSDYQKTYNKASNLSDKADELVAKAKKEYKNLGKTPISRIREVIKAQKGKGSAAANRYLSYMDKASEIGDKADALWRESDNKYNYTGRNFVSRVINNARYG